MKITKLMLSALVAAAALVSCNKENHSPSLDESVKTVEMSVANMIMTRGEAGDKIKLDGTTAVHVNDFQIFLTDNSYSKDYYEGVKIDGDNNDYIDAKFYWSADDLSAGFTSIEENYHYVSHHCTKIIAVANAGKQLTLAEALALKSVIGEQQDQKKLLLFAEADLVETGRTHQTEATETTEAKYSEVYEANPVLKPTVARFEVDGFALNYSGDEYTSVTVKDIAFQDYMPAMAAAVTPFRGLPGGEAVIPIANLDSDSDVYGWFNTGANNTGWFRDSFTGLVLDKPTDGTTLVKKDIAEGPRAYHFFAPAQVPDMIINLSVTGTSGTNIPAYIWTDQFSYLDDENVKQYLTSIEPGTVYRMSFAGEASGDGSIPFDEEDLNVVERCLDVTVDVHDWIVVLVTPEF